MIRRTRTFDLMALVTTGSVVAWVVTVFVAEAAREIESERWRRQTQELNDEIERRMATAQSHGNWERELQRLREEESRVKLAGQ